MIDERLMIGLRCREGVDLDLITKNWGWDQNQRKKNLSALYSQLKTFFEKGWVQLIGNRIKLTDPDGIAISNQILIEILFWWDSLPDAAVVQPTFEVHQ